MIFGRRNVRRMLDKLASSLPPKRVQKLERDLSLQNDQTRGAEWEVAIGYALAEAGKLEDFGNEKHGNPDFIWTPQEQPIIVEVTCVSDSGFHEHNPVDKFLEELRRISKKQGVSYLGTLSFDFGSVEHNKKITIAIPDKQSQARFFQSVEIRNFFNSIKSKPMDEHVLTFRERGATSMIVYRPGITSSSGHYRSYTVAQTFRHSPIFNTLKAKEAQIKKSGQASPAILFICDNDCNALQPSISRNTGKVSMRDIVGLFLNGQERRVAGGFTWQDEAKHIHAVIWLAVKYEIGILQVSTVKRLVADIEYASFANPYLRTTEFVQLLNKALAHLPVPIDTPHNAGQEWKYPRFYGRWKMSDRKIRFSALTLQKLLAGKITYQEFERDHSDLVAHIRRLDDKGMMLDQVVIEPCENEDDDWISFRFDGISPDRLFDDKHN